MPKKLVPNPDYLNAPFELIWRDRDGVQIIRDPLPPRFKEPFPATIKDTDSLARWALAHNIPSHIEVEEPCQ